MSPSRLASSPNARRGGRRVHSTARSSLVVLVVAVTAAGCSTSSARSATSTTATTPPGSAAPYASGQAGAGAATTRATRDATNAYSAQVDTATAAFVTAVGALQSDASSGDVVAARSDMLAAQADFDAFRVLEGGDAVNGAALDELYSDVGGGQSFGGLHAVERDLWTSGPLVADVSALAGQAPVAQFLLGRERLGPEAIGVVAVNQLDWVVDTALPVTQEQFAHRGLVDVAATEQAAHRAFSDVAPLARLVAPTLTSSVAGQFAVLDGEVAALGDPTSVSDTSVTPAARRALSVQLDATASTLARLTAALTPFGTRGAPS